MWPTRSRARSAASSASASSGQGGPAGSGQRRPRPKWPTCWSRRHVRSRPWRTICWTSRGPSPGTVQVELRPTDVPGVLEDVRRATALRPEAEHLRLEVVSEGDGLVALADSQRLIQVIDQPGHQCREIWRPAAASSPSAPAGSTTACGSRSSTRGPACRRETGATVRAVQPPGPGTIDRRGPRHRPGPGQAPGRAAGRQYRRDLDAGRRCDLLDRTARRLIVSTAKLCDLPPRDRMAHGLAVDGYRAAIVVRVI